MSSHSTVDKALSFLRGQIPAQVFSYLEGPMRIELSQHNNDLITTDDVVDVLMSLSDLFGSPVEDHQGEELKAYLVNAALFEKEPNETLLGDIERMTVDGVKSNNPVTGCPQDPLVGALYVACHAVPLKGNPVARLESITQALDEAANDILHYEA